MIQVSEEFYKAAKEFLLITARIYRLAIRGSKDSGEDDPILQEFRNFIEKAQKEFGGNKK